MPTFKKIISTTAEPIVATLPKGAFVDVFIQNLSANIIYVVSDGSYDITQGEKIAAGGTFSDDKCSEPVYVIASAASTDIRGNYYVYKDSTREVVL